MIKTYIHHDTTFSRRNQDATSLPSTGFLIYSRHSTKTLLKHKGIKGFFMSRWGFPDSSVDKESACNAEDPGSILGSGKSAGEGIGYPLQYSWASLVTQLVKNPPWIGKIPWRREWLPTPVFWPPTPVFWPREFHELYSPWGRKESDKTERLSL